MILRAATIVLGLSLMAGAEAHPGWLMFGLQCGLGLALFVIGLAPTPVKRPAAREIARSWGRMD